MTRFTTLTALLALVGCGSQGLDDPRFATGSTTMVVAEEGPVLYAVNVDEGTVSRLDADSGDLSEVDVGIEPTRIARVGDELWVTLRGERGVAILRDDEGSLQVDSVMSVSAEPFGVVASENGKRVYVAMSQADIVVEYDGKSKQELRRFQVQDDPRFLALHPSDRVLFVGSPYNGSLAWIDLVEGNVFPLQLPEGSRDTERGEVELTPRITGDLTLSVDGGELAVPTLYVDNETGVETIDEPDDRPTGGYGSSGTGVSRLNPAVVVIETDAESGIPEVDRDDHEMIFLANTVIKGDGRVQDTLRSYPSSVTPSPNGTEWMVTFEGSAAVAAVARKGASQGQGRGAVAFDQAATEAGMVPEGGGGSREPFTSPEQGGFVVHDMRFVLAQTGPRSVAFLGEETAYLHSWLDRSVSKLPYSEVHDELDGRHMDREFVNTAVAYTGRRLTESALSPEVEEGRKLFFSAVDERMAGSGAGVSCATCHFDGRNDGLTWMLDGLPRQTLSLAGPVNETAPVTWSNGVASVADEAMLTSSLRMGGNGLDESDAALIEAYVSWSRLPDTELAGSSNPLVAEGKEIFERAEVGCATCHSGEHFTDNQSHSLYSTLATQTPTLKGISATAPYLHDGSDETLRDLLERVRDGSMGDTSSLDDREMDALEAYLRSL